MALKLYLSHFRSDFYAVQSKVGLHNMDKWITYKILVQVVPLLANYGFKAISQSF